MKKNYTKPGVVKVKLSIEQAVLGTCSSDGISLLDGSPSNGCAAGGCKQKAHGGINSAGSS